MFDLFKRKRKFVDADEYVTTFQELAIPLMKSGDVDGVYKLFNRFYIEVLRKSRREMIVQIPAKRAMEIALNEVLHHHTRTRRRYFTRKTPSFRRSENMEKE